MNNVAKLLLSITVAASFSISTYAQTDTSNTDLNLGRMRLQKDFTQSITIKGEHLEKMPFASLSEAINAWTYGTFASQINYVVDGIVINDVNAYSVYDIKEVTLVQNALTQVNGANRQQLLVLVTTHKGGPGKQGLTVAGQSFMVKGDPASTSTTPSPSTETNFFHQYQLSAYRNEEHIQFGLSANYLRDVSPAVKNPSLKTVTPSNYDRFRLNGWFSTQLGKTHDLTVRLNVVPQEADAERTAIPGITVPITSNKSHSTSTIFNPSLTFRSKLLQGLTNEFTASYASYTSKGDQKITQVPNEDYYSAFNAKNKVKQVLLTDHIAYDTRLSNNWHVAPAVNFMFRHIKNDITATSIYQNGPPSGIGFPTNITTWTSNQKANIFLLTPSVNLYYSNSFNIQGGLMANLSKTTGKKIQKMFPFVSSSVDVLRLSAVSNPTSLKFFASYAQTNNMGDIPISLTNYPGSTPFPMPVFGTTVLYSPYAPDDSYWVWQAGTKLGIMNDRLTVNYLFERRNYTTEMYLTTPGGTLIAYPDLLATTHHIGVNATVLNKNSVYWLTGINATTIKSTIRDLNAGPFVSLSGSANAKDIWTGGLVNRFAWKHFVAGADLVYYFNPNYYPIIPGSLPTGTKVNAISLSNVYVGYQVKTKEVNNLEVYIDCRNLSQHKTYKGTGTQKYYGVGFKATL